MNTRIIPLLAVLAALTASGCADDRMSLEIRQTCYPTDTCVFSDTCDAQYLGTYTQVGANPLRVYFEIANQVPNNGDLSTGRVNSNDAHVTGAAIAFSGGRSGSGTIPLSNQVVPAEGTAVIGVSIPAGGSGKITAGISLTGYFDNGREFETGEFPFNYEVAAIAACAAGTVQVCPPGDGTTTRFQLPSVCAAP